MLTALMKWTSAAALAALFVSHSFPNIGFALALIIFGGASAVVFQAARAERYIWAGTFVLVALAFNPVVPVALPWGMRMLLYSACLVLFIWSVRLKTLPRMTIASITQMTPPGRSL